MAIRKKHVSSTKELALALEELRAALMTLREDDQDSAESLAMDARLAALYARCVQQVESERAAWVTWSASPRSKRA